MRFLPILLTTTIFTTTLFATEAVETTSATKPAASTTATTIAPNVQAQIDALHTLVSSTTEFNVSDAISIFFSPDLYPFISWRATTKDEAVLAKVKETMGEAIEREYNHNTLLSANALFAIMFPDFLENQPSNNIPSLEGIKKPTDLNELIEGTLFCGYYGNVIENFHLTLHLIA